jgi:hypothetical protein
MTASFARVCLMIVAVLGMLPSGAVALQRNESAARSTRTFQELFREYLQGDAEGAVRAFAVWDDERIEREAHLAPGTAGNGLAAALALFHSEAWLAGGRGHHTAAARLMTKEICPAAQSANDTTILALCRDWYPVMLDYLNFMDDTEDFLPGAASVQLARGALAEYMAGPALDSGGGADHGFGPRRPGEPYVVTSHGRFGLRIADAEAWFRRALKIDPRLAEARTRLGRVLFLLDHRDEARRELERALADAGTIGDTYSEYLAAMFLGRLHEESDRMDDAILAFRRAAAAAPRFPAARVALARLLAATGRPDEASATMAEFFRGLAPSGTSAVDPWTVYPRGRTFWYSDQILRALREAVRRR